MANVSRETATNGTSAKVGNDELVEPESARDRARSIVDRVLELGCERHETMKTMVDYVEHEMKEERALLGAVVYELEDELTLERERSAALLAELARTVGILAEVKTGKRGERGEELVAGARIRRGE